jgi:hypothetical protein
MYSSSHFSPVHQLVTWINNEIAALYPGCVMVAAAAFMLARGGDMLDDFDDDAAPRRDD